MSSTLNAIRLSGNLLSEEFIHTARRLGGNLPAFHPSTFDPDWRSDEDFEAELSRAWESLKDRFDEIRLELTRMDASTVRKTWLTPLLRALGFSPTYQKTLTRLPGVQEAFPITHRGWAGEHAPALVLLEPATDLDLKPDGRGARSPQEMLQRYLNLDREHTWALLSNGLVLRLLRDYYHTSQAGYVQFDLVQLFETRDYDDFRALYRLAHASRFEPSGEQDDEGRDIWWLETCYRISRSEGTRAEENLRKNVTAAIETLGNGLLTPQLRRELQGDPERTEEYYRQLLRVVYRCIFLFFAEQRGLVPTPAPHAELYRDEYSLTALRELAERYAHLRDDGRDLWERLLITFQLAAEGNEMLGVQAFGGHLFDPNEIYYLTDGVLDPAERNRRTDLPHLTNERMLEFIRHLAFTDAHGALERINYRDLKVEEIGHIYESLLDYAPRIATSDIALDEHRTVRAGEFFLDDRGTSRKSSGSYYTPRELVQEVISRALLPVIDERIAAAGDDPAAKEQALLGIEVLDPACGSAAFLIAANDALARRLADIRWEARSAAKRTQTHIPTDEDATPDHDLYQRELEHAKRDVLAHCIYGVDLNPMAVELARVALWINAAEAGKPLSLLDHRIKHGNSLVGAPLNFVQLGIHPDAYKGRGDEDKDTLKDVRAIFPKRDLERYRAQQEQGKLDFYQIVFPDLDALPENDRDQVAKKASRYQEFRNSDAFRKWRLAADYWTSAFFYPVKPDAGTIPNWRDLQNLLQSFDGTTYEHLVSQRSYLQRHGELFKIEALRDRYRFFHYWLEFPEVFFDDDGSVREGGGFDVIVGNPPWERVKLQEKEFFATRDEEIAEAPNAAKRKRLIAALATKNPKLYEAFQEALIEADATSNFLRVSGRYPLGGVGDVNTYQVFTENARDLTGERGRTGIIVPSGIATDNTTKDLFRDFVESRSLVSLDDFENRELIFPTVGAPVRFCLLILTAPGSGPERASFSFFNTNVTHLNDERRRFELSPEEFRLLNPNTLTCPTFRTKRDAEITLKMYRRAGVFIDENDPENGNPWGASFLRMFDMSNDSHLFRTKEELEAQSFELQGNRFVGNGETYLPLYEPKFIQIFDHRFNSYEGIDEGYRFKAKARTHSVTAAQKLKPAYVILPRFWVNQNAVAKVGIKKRWQYIYRDITNSTTNNRTTIICAVCDVAVGNASPALLISAPTKISLQVLANLASIPLDYVSRSKLGGAHLNFFIFRQLPVFSGSVYAPKSQSVIVSSVLELTYTAWDIKPFADDLWREADEPLRERFRAQWQANAEASGGGHPFDPPEWAEIDPDGCPLPPFTWNEERRAHLRAELDALFAHLYDLTREELEWILDPRDVDPDTPSVTFPGLRRNEEKQFGEYRTKRLVLEYYDRLAQEIVQDRVGVSLD